MNIPSSPSIVDLVAMQVAVTLLLLDDPRLAQVPVLPEYKLFQESDLLVDVLWTLPKSAFTVTPSSVVVNTQLNTGSPLPVGAGLLVEMVEASTTAPNVKGPPKSWDVHVVAFEERNLNLVGGNAGIGIMAEQLAQIVVDALHQQAVKPFGVLKVKNGSFMAPAHDWMAAKPVFAYRASLYSDTAIQQTPRTANPTILISGGNCTLTDTSARQDAVVRYTLDGSPAVGSNSSATQYSAPFAVSSGDVVTYAARSPGSLPSAINSATAP